MCKFLLFLVEDPSISQIRNATRQNIMKLLLKSVDQAAPNIAHCLLGFELRKPVHKTNLQDPGKHGPPSSR
jgi:nuclear pore complex protein Nup205